VDSVPARGDPGSPDQLRRIVADHEAADPREAASMARLLAELDRLPQPFDDKADPVHVTASAIVVGPRGVILHLHRRLGRWLQPGGHIDPGESPADAALRESQEETGLELHHPPGGPKLLHIDAHHGALGHTHLDLRYLLAAPDAEPDPPPGESPAVGWFTWEEAAAMTDEALAVALRKARSVNDR